MPAADAVDAASLQDLVRQTKVSGVSRRVILLHLDRLPPSLARPQHKRLARAALAPLSDRDHAQSFDLPKGRLAIVWRGRGPDELAGPMAAINHLLSDLPSGAEVSPGHIVSVFDLPDQGPWLLDTLREEPHCADAGNALDAALLAQLEASLVQVDLAPFLRRRLVMDLSTSIPAVAWEDITVAWQALADCLCPGRDLRGGGWLAHRLALSIERRILATLTGRRQLGGVRDIALALGTASILSPAFSAFDAALPAASRGHVVLRLEAADILADPARFCFARNFCLSRGYRLLLRHTGAKLLDVDRAGFDWRELPAGSSRRNEADAQGKAAFVAIRIDTPPQREWARAAGITLARGRALTA